MAIAKVARCWERRRPRLLDGRSSNWSAQGCVIDEEQAECLRSQHR